MTDTIRNHFDRLAPPQKEARLEFYARYPYNETMTCVMNAAIDGHMDVLDFMIKYRLSAFEELSEELRQAAKNEQMNAFKALMQVCSVNDLTPVLEIMANQGRLDYVRLIVEHTQSSEHISLALRIAAWKIKEEMVEHLLPMASEEQVNSALIETLGAIATPIPELIVSFMKTHNIPVQASVIERTVIMKRGKHLELFVEASQPDIVEHAIYLLEGRRNTPERDLLMQLHQVYSDKKALEQSVDHIVPIASGVRKM